MDNIINPAWFYWLNVVDNIRTTAEVVMFIVICTAFVTLLLTWFDDSCLTLQKAKKYLIVIGVILLVAIMIVLFVPSRQAMIEMQVARYATYDNVSLTVDGIKEIADYIVASVKDIVSGG